MVAKTKVDKFGRILVPKELREGKGLEGEVELVEVPSGILIRPVSSLREMLDEVYSSKLRVNWGKSVLGDLSNESLDDYWL